MRDAEPKEKAGDGRPALRLATIEAGPSAGVQGELPFRWPPLSLFTGRPGAGPGDVPAEARWAFMGRVFRLTLWREDLWRRLPDSLKAADAQEIEGVGWAILRAED